MHGAREVPGHLEGHPADRAESLRLERTVELEPLNQRQRPPGRGRVAADVHQEDGQLGRSQVVIGLPGQKRLVGRERTRVVPERCLAPRLAEEELRIAGEARQPLVANLQRIARPIELEVERRKISVGPSRTGRRSEHATGRRLRPGGLIGLEVGPGGDRQRVLEARVRVHQRDEAIRPGEAVVPT